MEHEKLLNTAKKNLSYVQKSKLYKFKYMDSWCFEYSKFLMNEVNNRKGNSRRKYKRYPKGTIIYAKLGINIGHEFSGNHFCVVLNKNDSFYNPILTVIPLTSSSTKFNIFIDEGILQLATQLLYKQAKTVADKLKNHVQQITESSIPNDPHLLAVNEELHEESEQLFKVYDRYERFRKTNTYANILNIITISKDRITKINNYDPAGEMQYSQNTIKKIDESINERFLN